MRRGNGDGSIFKLSGKRRNPYAVRITKGWTEEGKQIYAYIGYYKTKTEAKKHLNEYLVNPYDTNDFTTNDIFEKWVKTSRFSEEVLKNYKRVIDNSGLGKKVFKDIKLLELEEKAKDLTPAMQKRFKASFKNLYIYAMKNDIVTKNLADLMELDKYKAKERDAIAPKDIEKMLKGNDVIPKILLYTGMRIDELLKIETKNVDLEKRVMIGGLKTEAGKNRKIPIHKEILPIIAELLNEKNEYLIVDENGKQVTYDNYLKKWHEDKTRTKYTPHYTRHTFISQAVKCNINKVKIQKIVGHSTKDVTDHYTHFTFDDLIDAIDQFKY
jgi:integrase